MGHDKGEERRRGVEDRGEARGDLRLAPEDEAERHETVQHARGCVALPRRAVAEEGSTGNQEHEVERGGGEHHATEHDGDKQLGQGDLGEEERAAPQDREQDEEGPFACPHRPLLSRPPISIYPLAASNPVHLTLQLRLGPGVAQLDRAIEHQSLRPARKVRTEIALPLELHGFPSRCFSQRGLKQRARQDFE